MKIGKTLYIRNRTQWRSWLRAHHKSAKEVWLVYYRKNSAKPRIPYNDAVEEALCYGWIDSTVKNIDEERFAQRFTPRATKSSLSQMNKERVRMLIRQHKITKAGLAVSGDVNEESFVIPSDILKALKTDAQTWNNFHAFPEYYKRIRIAFIDHGRKHGQTEFQKRLKHFVRMSAQNKRFGMVQ